MTKKTQHFFSSGHGDSAERNFLATDISIQTRRNRRTEKQVNKLVKEY
jgi:hypothetical protein